jgi:thiol:disulfide interchange protein
MKSRLFLMMMMIVAFCATIDAQSLFTDDSYDDMVSMAKKEKKPYFVDITASWCLPCKLMDETVFQEQMVKQYVKENYRAIQLDVEDFDAMILKSEYQVKSLPTILFFNSKGKMISKEEGLQTGTNFLFLLKKHSSN